MGAFPPTWALCLFFHSPSFRSWFWDGFFFFLHGRLIGGVFASLGRFCLQKALTVTHTWFIVVKRPLGNPFTYSLAVFSECLCSTMDFIFWVCSSWCLAPFAVFALFPLQCFLWGYMVMFNISVVCYYFQVILLWHKPAGANMSESRNFCLGFQNVCFQLKVASVWIMCVCSCHDSHRSHPEWFVFIKPFSSTLSDLTYKILKRLIWFLMTYKAKADRSVAQEAEDNPLWGLFFAFPLTVVFNLNSPFVMKSTFIIFRLLSPTF